MVHVVVRSQKQVLDTMLIIKRGAFHQTVLNNGATIVKSVFFTGVDTCPPSGFSQKCGPNLIKY